MLECRQEAAASRNALDTRLGKQEKKDKNYKAHAVSELAAAEAPLTPKQKLELQGVHADIFQYFGVVCAEMSLKCTQFPTTLLLIKCNKYGILLNETYQ